FGTTLSDCASLRNVLSSESSRDLQNPKESFLTIMMRNVLCSSDEDLVSQEDVLIALPRPSRGGTSPLLKYVPKSVRAALAISVCVDNFSSDGEGGQPEEQDDSSGSDTSSVPERRVTMSEFLAECEKPRTVNRPEGNFELEADIQCPVDFEAHSLAYSPSMTVPKSCCLPVLCMAEEDDLPLLMASMLYQRLVWRISEPLIGVAFSKYDTSIHLLLGWLEESTMHIGRIDHSPMIDLSKPLAALALSRVLLSLENHISKVRASAYQAAAIVSTEIQQQSVLSWRLDTSIVDERSLWAEDIHRRVVAWTEGLEYIFYWMLDRKAIVRSVLSDNNFRTEYNDLTSFIWPKEWDSREKLPHVDRQLQPSMDLLFRQVEEYRRLNQPERIAVCDFPEEYSDQLLSILSGRFSAIFQACGRARAKMRSADGVIEDQWRHDHERLLFDFFTRNIQEQFPSSCTFRMQVSSSSGQCTTEILEGTSEELPGSFFVDHLAEGSAFTEFIDFIHPVKGETLREWAQSRGGHGLETIRQERSDRNHLMNHAQNWDTTRNYRTLLERLGSDPAIGRCDALGTLCVDIPDTEHTFLDGFSFAFPPSSRTSDRTHQLKPAVQENEELLSTPSSHAADDFSITPITTSNFVLNSNADFDTVAIDNATTDGLVHTTPQKLGANSPPTSGAVLELPLLVVNYKKASTDVAKFTNRHRIYSVAAVKFLEDIGITDFPVFSALTDGPKVSLPSAWLTDEIVHIFERNTQSFDISTPLGAWHYATVLCRIAVVQARKLRERYEEVREEFLGRAQGVEGKELKTWTLDAQVRAFEVNRTAVRAKPPPRGDDSYSAVESESAQLRHRDLKAGLRS
ncbi:hypothetical protein B0H21DRAFT_700160, partial [Amylocystis lapponica]